ncbi:MAG: hypothetical protein J6N21_08070 [Butyrivibrio sp.]|nr:hypothetical protein [Butyrivibrio sp.]
MKIKCDYCGNTYEDTQEKCPSCGAPNPSHQNTGQPKTIEELKDWYRKRNLPDSEVTRFFIGEDYKQPKAFGIYKDENGQFIVYKNKADGSRAVRYQGKDEEYAVNELYQKLKDEIVHQKYLNDEKRPGNSSSGTERSSSNRNKKSKSILDGLLVKGGIFLGIMFLISTFVITPFKNRHNGYYNYDSNYIYSYQDDWYYWDDSEWIFIDQDIPDNKAIINDIESNRDEYYLSKEWNSTYTFDNWDNSPYYQQYQSSDTSDHDSDRDTDYDWDSNDSWDSGGTDWDTDW